MTEHAVVIGGITPVLARLQTVVGFLI